MKPSIGRIVHKVNDDGGCVAAVITQVGDSCLLFVMDPAGTRWYFTPAVFDENKGLATWHWPERIDG